MRKPTVIHRLRVPATPKPRRDAAKVFSDFVVRIERAFASSKAVPSRSSAGKQNHNKGEK